MGPKLLERAGELADGALPFLFPPEHYPPAVAQITTGLDRVRRDPSSIDIAACVWCSIDADRARANRALAEKIAYYGASFSPHLLARAGLTQDDFPREMTADQVTAQMLSLGIAGDAAEVTERCRTLVAAGATSIPFCATPCAATHRDPITLRRYDDCES